VSDRKEEMRSSRGLPGKTKQENSPISLIEKEVEVRVGPLSPKGVFVSLKSDFGIKRVFRSEAGKKDLMKMLNAISAGYIEPVESIDFDNVEWLGKTKEERNAIYDIVFNDNKNRVFELEMQQNSIRHMLNRSFCYTCRYHSETMLPGSEYKFDHSSITGVLIADFELPELIGKPAIVLHQVGGLESGHMTVPLTQILTIELPKVNKGIDELNCEKDVYLYLLSNMGNLDSIPECLNNEKYWPIFERARIANFNKKEMKRFNALNKQEETRRLEMLTAIAEGEERGEIKGKIEGRDEIIRKMILDGRISLADISEITGISLKDLEVRHEALLRENASG